MPQSVLPFSEFARRFRIVKATIPEALRPLDDNYDNDEINFESIAVDPHARHSLMYKITIDGSLYAIQMLDGAIRVYLLIASKCLKRRRPRAENTLTVQQATRDLSTPVLIPLIADPTEALGQALTWDANEWWPRVRNEFNGSVFIQTQTMEETVFGLVFNPALNAVQLRIAPEMYDDRHSPIRVGQGGLAIHRAGSFISGYSFARVPTAIQLSDMEFDAEEQAQEARFLVRDPEPGRTLTWVALPNQYASAARFGSGKCSSIMTAYGTFVVYRELDEEDDALYVVDINNNWAATRTCVRVDETVVKVGCIGKSTFIVWKQDSIAVLDNGVLRLYENNESECRLFMSTCQAHPSVGKCLYGSACGWDVAMLVDSQ